MLEQYETILVTGGCGFIGSHLTNALLSLGKEVLAFDNLSTGSEKNLTPGVRIVRGDIRNPKHVSQAAKDADLIFHVAANPNGTLSVNHPRQDFEINTLGTFNVLEAALNARVKKVVYVSSASVYGIPQRFPIGEDHPTNPIVPYGASKLSSEILCKSFFRTYELPVVICRPFCVYGPRENPEIALVEVSRYLRWHLNGGPIKIVGDPDRKTRDFVHVSDVIQGLILLADRADPGEVYNLGSGEEVSMRQLTEIIGSVTGRPAVVETISHIPDDTYRLVSDIAKACAQGYSPKISLSEGIKQLAQELGENPSPPMGATIFRRGQRGEV